MIKYFGTLNDIFNAATSDLQPGDVVVTGGYGSVNDGGASTYYVTSINNTNNADLDITGKTFSKGSIQLELMFNNGEVNVEQFGAQSTASAANNKAAIQAAIDSGARCVNFRPVQYLVEDDIVINHPVDIAGNGTKLTLIPTVVNSNTHLFCLDFEPCVSNLKIATNIKDMFIVGVTTNALSKSIPSIRINCANRVCFENVCFEGGDYAVYAKKSNNTGCDIRDISISNCKATNMNSGFAFNSSSDIKVKNCRIELREPTNITYGFGFVLDNTYKAFVEDLSVLNATMSAVGVGNKTWDNNSTNRIVFKNLLVDNAIIAISLTNCNLPISFNNAMLIDCDYSFYVADAENITVSNSSFSAKSPLTCAADTRILTFTGYSKMKFMHTQFDFPYAFQAIVYNSEKEKPVELDFVDCTLQKIDVSGLSDTIIPSGFGLIGYEGEYSNRVIQTFDACEFRSYITDYSVTTGEGENAVTTYNFPITLATSSNSDSKLIIKNCRFINEDNSDDEQDETQGETQDETQPPKEYIPYFKLDDNAKFDNIVVYNCFFENYEFSKGEGEDKHYPIFGRVVDGAINTDNTDSDNETIHNIFARCNMRSSAPDTANGTTINEMLEYI